MKSFKIYPFMRGNGYFYNTFEVVLDVNVPYKMFQRCATLIELGYAY